MTGDRLLVLQDAVPDTLGGLLEAEERPEAAGIPLEPLVREWLSDLEIQGRSDQTIQWYRHKMTGYLRTGGAATLGQLTGADLKRYLAELPRRGLSADTVHGCFATIRAFAGWASRENYEVELSLFRVRPPKVPQKDMETYSEAQLETVLRAAPEGWPRLAILILLGTGMRVGELCALTLEDIEDEGDAAFLKIRRGKGAKFRRVPVSRRLRRELIRYLNRVRPETATCTLLVRPDGQPVRLQTVTELLKRIRARSDSASMLIVSATPSRPSTCGRVARSSACAGCSVTRPLPHAGQPGPRRDGLKGIPSILPPRLGRIRR